MAVLEKENFFTFNKNNAKEKLERIFYLKQDAINKLKQKTKQAIEIEHYIDSRFHELYVYYLTDYHIKLSSKEAKDFAEKDKEVLDKKKQLYNIKADIKALEETIKNLNDMMWGIKTYLEWLKLENGLL